MNTAYLPSTISMSIVYEHQQVVGDDLDTLRIEADDGLVCVKEVLIFSEIRSTGSLHKMCKGDSIPP